MQKIIPVLFLTVLIAANSANAINQDCGNNCGDMPQEGFIQPPPPCPSAEERDNFKQRLNLTEEQRLKAREIRIQAQEKMHPLINELKAKESLKMDLKSKDADKKQIEQVNNDIKHLNGQLHGIIMQNERDFIQILTPVQKEEFNNIREEKKREFRERRFQTR